ncbi:hypothetical protein [Parabacteroides sp. FAFU027]|uniref:hypothetical protein n=1 Tax=Parabacteroides sp. FAFU027 TaxID=2922715 RepID=UPI001FAECEEC|nr:hypothetical protein [Parabacteroides sp. FAFU027]
MIFNVMNSYLRLSVIVLLLLSSYGLGFAQVWQWSVPVKGAGIDNNARAFLWVPEECKQIHGLILAQHNMEEISILENPVFRKEMAKIGFAEVWVSPSPNVLKFYDFSIGAYEITNAYLDSLAFVSGYDEIRYAPVVPIGHSAAASMPYYFGVRNMARTLACVSVSGQWPYVREGNFTPNIWTKEQTLDYIPCLETMGEYEAAATWSKEGLKERQEHPLLPLSMLAVPGEGHFASSDRKAAFIAFYIQKAAQYRLPKTQEKGKSIVLTPIDPTKSGWLAEKWKRDSGASVSPAPICQYQGNPKEAFWFFDKEMVDRVQEYQSSFRGLKPQLVGYIQNGKMAEQRNTHIQVTMKFLPAADGMTFHLKGGFYDTVPAVSNRLTDWTQLPVGTKLGHSNNTEAICLERICGPSKIINDTTFKFQLDRSVDLSGSRYSLTFAVKHPGDLEYKSAVQQGDINIPAVLKEGKSQTITFLPIANQKAGVRSLKLRATSDAGKPVQFYVLEGPAEVDRNMLNLTPIPPMAKYPVKVTVVAWQYGSSVEPKLKTAEPVIRSFYLMK